MATQTSNSFIANLGKIYGGYAGGFIGFVIILGILEQMGVPNKIIGYCFVFLTIAVYAYIGILSRTMEISEYYVAGRVVPPFFNGMATGADWMSAASFISMAGGLYLAGYGGLGYVLGWTGGYVLVGVLLAPYLRKFGQFTVPDFLGVRYEGNTARVCGVIVLFSASFTYIVAQTYGIGIITSRFLGISFEVAIFVGLLGILVCSMLGGMRAVTWTQVAQYIILIIAYLIPVVWLSVTQYGNPIPELAYGQVLDQIADLEKKLGIAKPHVAPFTDAKGVFSWTGFHNFWALVLCLMVGTASLPHILMRYFTTPNVRDARKSVGWSIFFIFLLYFTAPAYAAFAKLEVYRDVIGQQISQLPAWVQNWSQVGGLLTIKDGNNDGILQLSEFVINQDIIVLSMPEIAGLPYVISGLVAAVHRRRSASRHRERFEPRHLLQDDQPESLHCDAPHRRSCAAGRCRDHRGGSGWNAARRHHSDGGVGVLAGCGRAFRTARARYLVETHNSDRSDRRHDVRLRYLSLLPGRHALFRHAAVVRDTQHLERVVWPAGSVHRHLGGEPDDSRALQGNAGLRRFHPDSQGRNSLDEGCYARIVWHFA
jgi:Na+(H+)/acetate symporter ActP